MRPPTQPHQRGERGHTPLREDDTKKMSAAERRRSDVPVKPSRFSEVSHKDLGVIWDKHIVPCTWMIEADTPKAAMFCYLWREYWKDPDKMPTPRVHQLRYVMSELGMDSLSRARIDRADLPVRKHDNTSHNNKGKAGENKRRKAEKKNRTQPGGFDEYT